MALKNDKYNQILREYDNRQFQNKHDLDRRLKQVYEAIPELKQLAYEMITLSAESGRLALRGDTASLMELKAKTFDIKARQMELLISNGYPSDYLELKYQCSKCKDTGFIGNEKCSCFKQAIADLIYAGSNIKSVLEYENFNTFSFKYYSDDFIDEATGLSPLSNMQKIVAGCKSFIRHFGKKPENLLFLGNTGVGKTFLANCIAKDLLDRGFTVIYLTAFRLFDILEKNKFGKDEETSYIASNQFEYILDCDLLIIDDLGTEMNNSFTASQLYLIINERLLKQKSTIISTNLSHDNMNAYYGERVYSRIISNYSIRRIIGEDIRLQKAVGN
ncbi:ATP-binding protein [Mobilitalea sibirica]|uniref:ATP-binding protein n=1 Tax=Mobilitalea sibirica TaxID=1462919 RepID=A0A8J7H4W8_9FIRM|nr:ATP-binding protein [Mobilitalea sibirica]MBH1942122.1 ATP-binding protein [Mobilitalea sibirica]